MRKLYQKGFGTTELFVIAFALVLVSGVGWYVLKYRTATPKTKNSGNTETTQANLISFDQNMAPKDWRLTINDPANTMRLVNGKSESTGQYCYVDVTKHQSTKGATVETLEAEYEASEKHIAGDVFMQLAKPSIVVRTSQGTKTLSGYLLKINPGTKNITTPQHVTLVSQPEFGKRTYLISAEYTWEINQSCQSNAFTESDQALRAITIRL